MKRKAYLSYEKIPAADGAICRSCRESFEISLLVPPESQGGNRRRLKRFYQCENCAKVFSKYDWGYALIFMFSPKRIAEYLFRSPRSRLREIPPQHVRQVNYRGQFHHVDFASKKARENAEKGQAFDEELETATNKNQDQQSGHFV